MVSGHAFTRCRDRDWRRTGHRPAPESRAEPSLEYPEDGEDDRPGSEKADVYRTVGRDEHLDCEEADDERVSGDRGEQTPYRGTARGTTETANAETNIAIALDRG